MNKTDFILKCIRLYVEEEPSVFVITGIEGQGKTSLAVALADELPVSVIHQDRFGSWKDNKWVVDLDRMEDVLRIKAGLHSLIIDMHSEHLITPATLRSIFPQARILIAQVRNTYSSYVELMKIRIKRSTYIADTYSPLTRIQYSQRQNASFKNIREKIANLKEIQLRFVDHPIKITNLQGEGWHPYGRQKEVI